MKTSFAFFADGSKSAKKSGFERAIKTNYPNSQTISDLADIPALSEAKLIYNWYSKGRNIQKSRLNRKASSHIMFSGRDKYPFSCLTDKASLVEKFEGQEYFPESYVLQVKNGKYAFPKEFLASFKKSKSNWIAKSPLGSLGSNIELISAKSKLKEVKELLNRNFNEISFIERKKRYKRFGALNNYSAVKKRMKTVVISRYIGNTILVEGRKIDVRAYLIIFARPPAMAFYHPGHGRMCGSQYTNEIKEKSAHITNQAFQLSNPSLLKSWKECMDMIPFPEDEIESQIIGIFADTLKFVEKEIAVNAKRFSNLMEFYLFGVDFMITQEGKVKLIEFNARPSMKSVEAKNPHMIEEMTQLLFQIENKNSVLKNSSWKAV